MTKKILSVLLAVAMLLSMMALVACNGGNQGNNGNQGVAAGMAEYAVPEVGYDGSAVTVVFYHSMGAKLQGVLNDYIEDFNIKEIAQILEMNENTVRSRESRALKRLESQLGNGNT